MIHLRRLTLFKKDPSINQKGETSFVIDDVYVRESHIYGVYYPNQSKKLDKLWWEKEFDKYCEDNKITICTVLLKTDSLSNIISDETVEKLKLL